MDAASHRANARNMLRGNWVNAVAVCLLANLISGAGGGPSINFNLESSQPVQVTVPETMEQFLHGSLGIAMPLVLGLSLVLLAVRLVLGGVMELGVARYNLNLIEKRDAGIGDLFAGFPQFAEALVMNLVSSVLVFVGMMLLVIPGLMLDYGFAMAPYILADDPGCSGTDALRRSYRMMKGHRCDLLWLELTFFGWDILASLSLGLGHLVLNPYKEAARASFYQELKWYDNAPKVEF